MNQPAIGPPTHTTGYTALAGKRIVVTRARHQATEMADLLRLHGAEPVLYPCIKIVLPQDTAALDGALKAAAAGEYDWLVVTSTNVAMILAQRLAALAISLDGLRIAAVGPKTATAVCAQLDLAVDLVAEEYVAESLASALNPAPGQRFLLPQSAIARPVLSDALRLSGAEVTAVDAYGVDIGQGGASVPSLLAAGRIDAVTFTSSSTVGYFLKRLHQESGRIADLDGICLAAIGPVTAEKMDHQGLPVSVMPAEYTVASLVSALETYFQRND